MVRFLTFLLLFTSFTIVAESKPYDPLKISGGAATSLTFEVQDRTRDRTLPLRVYLPQSAKPAPVILFSHGLGGSRDNNPYLGNHWAPRGYLVVFVQHPGSDEAFWDATLQANPAATAWLNGKAARSVLQSEDVWQWNGR